MRIIYFGTPRFAADILDFLLKSGVSVQAVVTKPDRPQGRSKKPVPTPVKEIALAQRVPLPVYQPEIVSDLNFAPTLKQYQPDLFVVVAYGEIIKDHLLNMPKMGCINLHASLLPKFRGAAPIQRAIIEGEAESGVTVMHMVKKMDAGDIIEDVHVPIGLTTTYGELEQELCKAGGPLMLKVIRDFEKGNIKRSPQDPSKVTFAKKIELEDCKIDWNADALTIHNWIRGVNPEPGSWCWLETKNLGKKRLKIFSSLPIDKVSSYPPGTLFDEAKERIMASTGKGTVQLLEVQLEGKKRMNAVDLFRGLSNGPWQILD